MTPEILYAQLQLWSTQFMVLHTLAVFQAYSPRFFSCTTFFFSFCYSTSFDYFSWTKYNVMHRKGNWFIWEKLKCTFYFEISNILICRNEKNRFEFWICLPYLLKILLLIHIKRAREKGIHKHRKEIIFIFSSKAQPWDSE